MSDHANPAADILPRSVWEGAAGTRVQVLGTAGGYVRHAAIGQTAVLTHHHEFRAAFRPIYDRAQVRGQFTMSQANLGEFRVYWLADLRRIVTRSVSCQRQFRVPDGALEVGIYSSACPVATFFEDLEEIINKGADHGSAAARAALAGCGG